MVDVAVRRRIAHEVYMITGVLVPDDDVLMLAALFYSEKMQEAARQAASHFATTNVSTRAIVDDAAATVRKAAASNKALADAIEARVKKAVLEAGRFQSNQDGPPTRWRGVLAGVALGIYIAGGVVSVACGFSFSWIADAHLGMDVKRAMATLEPGVRDKLIEHLEKQRRLSDVAQPTCATLFPCYRVLHG